MAEHTEHRPADQTAQEAAIDEVMSELRREIDRVVATAIRRVHALAPAKAPIPDRPIKLISVGAAGLKAKLSDDRVRALCRKHPYGNSPSGFGFKTGGRWRVVEPAFLKYLDRGSDKMR